MSDNNKKKQKAMRKINRVEFGIMGILLTWFTKFFLLLECRKLVKTSKKYKELTNNNGSTSENGNPQFSSF